MAETAVNVIDEWLSANVPGGNTAYNLIFCLAVYGFVIVPKDVSAIAATQGTSQHE